MQQEEKGGKTRGKKKGGRESQEGGQGNGNASTCHNGGSPSNYIVCVGSPTLLGY
jgi:hypothetical protein